MTTVRVVLPPHLRVLARTEREIPLEVQEPPSLGTLLDALEALHPVLRGTIRYHGHDRRRPLLRFHADGRDLSHEPLNTPLPDGVVSGREAVYVVGAIAGG